MIQMPMAEVQPGMVVARSILGSATGVQLAAGYTLDEPVIARCRREGMRHLWVHLDGEDILPAGNVNDQLALQAQQAWKDNMSLLQKIGETQDSTLENLTKFTADPGRFKNMVATEQLKSIVDQIIRAIMGQDPMMVNLASMRTKDGYLHQHALDVTITATMIATKLKYGIQDIQELALGCFVMDLGMIIVPDSMFTKKGALTLSETHILQEHPSVGFAILRANEGISINTAHVAYQHHERLDGRGYPRQLRADDVPPQKTLINSGGHIHRYAQIAAVADMYITAINPRPGTVESALSAGRHAADDRRGRQGPQLPRGQRPHQPHPRFSHGHAGGDLQIAKAPPDRAYRRGQQGQPGGQGAPGGDPGDGQVPAPHQTHCAQPGPGKRRRNPVCPALRNGSFPFKGNPVPPRRIVPAGRKTFIFPMRPMFPKFRWGRLQATALCLLAFSACSRGKEITRAPPPSFPERALIPERTPIPERTLQVTAAAYNSTVAQTDSRPSEAAWGDSLVPGMRAIAISRDLIPLGLGQGVTVRIEGLPGEYTVLDKMDARWRKRIDVYFGKDVAAAREWGEKQVVIRWLDTGSVDLRTGRALAEDSLRD